MKSFIVTAVQGRIARNALGISLAVGTLLNLINQGQQLIAWTDIDWSRVALNYLVPYCVATFSAAKNELALRRS